MPLIKDIKVAKGCLDLQKKIALLIFSCSSLLCSHSLSAASFEGNEIKAAYIYNIAKYIRWPETEETEGGIEFCTFDGETELSRAFEAFTSGELVQGRAIKTNYKVSLDNLAHCDVLFTSQTYLDSVAGNLKGLPDKNILLISDVKGFSERGGMIELVQENRRIKLYINKQQLKLAGLTASSKLLRIATIVKTNKGEK